MERYGDTPMVQKSVPDERGHRHPPLSQRRNVVGIADEAWTRGRLLLVANRLALDGVGA